MKKCILCNKFKLFERKLYKHDVICKKCKQALVCDALTKAIISTRPYKSNFNNILGGNDDED